MGCDFLTTENDLLIMSKYNSTKLLWIVLKELKAIKNSLCQMSMNKSEPSKDEESTSE